jgi:hypothetical protein
MLHRTRVAVRSLSLLIGPALLLALGCSDDGLGQRYSVSGAVEYNGMPLAKGAISFNPKEGSGHGASGQIEDGKFSSLTTMADGDGVMAGEYIVTITAKELDQAKVSSEAEKLATKHGMKKMDMIPPELMAKASKEAKSSIPKKYESAATSDLKATVGADSKTFKFELKD